MYDMINRFQLVGGYGVMREPEVEGLYYMRARFYDAVDGRFISRDKWTCGPDDNRIFFSDMSNKEIIKLFVLMESLQDPKKLYVYLYAYNNPSNLIDFCGFSPISLSGKNIDEIQSAIDADREGLDYSPNWFFIGVLGGYVRISKAGIRFIWRGGEIVVKKLDRTILRINPVGDWKSQNPNARRPHYHRRPGIGKHRPWEGGF